MITNTMDRFEAGFPEDYRKEEIAKIISYVTSGKFCQLICAPGGGKATLLKILVNNKNVRLLHLKDQAESTYFLYINLLELPDFTESSIYKFLLISLDRMQRKTLDSALLPTDAVVLLQSLKDTIDVIANQEHRTPVLLLDHFDEYQNRLPRSFFQMLRTLKSLAKYRLSVVFATRRPLLELVDPEIFKEFYDFFVDNAVYMALSSPIATDFIVSQVQKQTQKTLLPKDKEALIQLTSGHTKLLKVCIESVLQEQITPEITTLLEKPIVKGALYELWYFLTAREQQALALSIQLDMKDNEYLGNIGLLRNGKITIPLLEEFIKTVARQQSNNEAIVFDPQTKEIKKGEIVISDLLSSLEFKLLRFLIQNKDRMIEREEIIKAVWPESKNMQGISDQAIDQLIFRLRHKIENDPNIPVHLQTVKGRGFRFIA